MLFKKNISCIINLVVGLFIVTPLADTNILVLYRRWHVAGKATYGMIAAKENRICYGIIYISMFGSKG